MCDLKGLPRPARPTQRVKDLANAKVSVTTGAQEVPTRVL